MFKLLIDMDRSVGTNYVELVLGAELTPQGFSQSGYQWQILVSAFSAPIQDDVGNSEVTQNSQNYAFYGIPDYNAGTGFSGPPNSTSFCKPATCRIH